MTKNNVLYGAVLAALCAFSSQADTATKNIDGEKSVSRKYNSADYTNSPKEMNLTLLNEAIDHAISSSAIFCNTLDNLYKKIILSPISLSDETYHYLLACSDMFNTVGKLFAFFMDDNFMDDNLDKLPIEIEKKLQNAYKSYGIASNKLTKLTNLGKQIKEVPTYFTSDIDMQSLQKLAEHSKRVSA